jgi:GTP pyrophosphokinase
MTEDASSTGPASLAHEVLGGAEGAPLLGSRFREALVFASTLHAMQTRKATGIPYVAHLLAVTSLALEHGATEDVAIAALLHDAVEDQGGQVTAEAIRVRFGDGVTEIVLACTDTDVTPKPPWRERKERYLAHVKDAPVEVRLVSLSDKVHNARSILADHRLQGPGVWSRFRGGKEGILWYYRSLVEAFRDGPHSDGTRRLAAELGRLVADLEKVSATEDDPPNSG